MRLRYLCLALTIALAPLHLPAQSVGSISGLVTDPAGAVVAHATITAVQKSTNFSRSTTTSSSGTYSLPRLQVGTYTVTAQLAGFDKSQIDVRLDVDEKREVDFRLVLKGLATTVSVSATAPTIDTTDGMIGGLVTERQVANLPLNGRDITNLILMQPGQVPDPNSGGTFDTFTAGNGNRGTTVSSFLDGMDTSDNELGGGQFGNFNLDAIAEFRVLQNDYSAEYGRGSGTVVNIVSKSGTNEFHGSAFEFLRNNVLDARNFFAPSVAPFRRNEFGMTFGGPILIPKIYNGRNKTFFFFQYAGYRERIATPVVMAVPTLDERKGLVTITPATGAPYQLQVPTTPAAASILNQYPLPNNPNGPLGPRTFQSAYSLATNRDQYSGRLDQHFSDKDTFFFRYSVATNVQPFIDPNEDFINPHYSPSVRNDWNNGGLSETHLFSANLVNEFRISGMQSIEQNSTPFFGVTQVTFADSALYPYGTTGGGFSAAPFTMVYRDGMNWVKGQHTMAFGAEYRKTNSSYFGASIGGPNGAYTFAAGSPLPVGIPSSDGAHNLKPGDPSPSALVSFILGTSQFFTRAVSYPGFGPSGGGFAPFSMRRHFWSGWFQDDFQVSRKLTLNLGLRYEYNSVPYETENRLAGIINIPSSPLFAQMVLNPEPIYRSDYTGFAPRFGYAWRVLPKTVLRGGFAIFTNLPLSQTADQQGFNFPFAGYSSIPNAPFSSTPLPVSLPPLTTLSGTVLPPPGGAKAVPPNTPIDLKPFPGLETNLTSNDLHNGYTMSGNFTVEHQLPWSTALQASYVFNNSVGLYAGQFPNGFTGAPPSIAIYTRVNPSLGEIQLTDNHAHSTYNALQALLRKITPIAGLTFQLSYTWSKAIDNATTVYNGDAANSGAVPQNPECWSCEKGLSSLDVPQHVVANFSYQMPFDKLAPNAPKRLTQGWQLWGIITASSGYPFTVLTPYGSKAYGIDTYLGGTVRPDLVSTPTIKHSGEGPEEQFFSNAVLQDNANLTNAVNSNQSFMGSYFAIPLTTLNGTTVQVSPGNLGRNTFRTAGYSDFDLSLAKDTKLFERSDVQFRAEFFNVLNQHAFGAPGRVLTAPGFGISTGTQSDPREIQLALRLIF